MNNKRDTESHNAEEEFAQEMGVTVHQLQFMTAHQLKEKAEKEIWNAYCKVNATKYQSKFRAPTSICPRQHDLGISSKLEQTPPNNPIKFEFRVEGYQSNFSWNTKLFLSGGFGVRKTFGSAGENSWISCRYQFWKAHAKLELRFPTKKGLQFNY